jgi:hypothetical protein
MPEKGIVSCLFHTQFFPESVSTSGGSPDCYSVRQICTHPAMILRLSVSSTLRLFGPVMNVLLVCVAERPR